MAVHIDCNRSLGVFFFPRALPPVMIFFLFLQSDRPICMTNNKHSFPALHCSPIKYLDCKTVKLGEVHRGLNSSFVELSEWTKVNALWKVCSVPFRYFELVRQKSLERERFKI